MVTMQIIGTQELALKLKLIKGITRKAVKLGLMEGGRVIQNAAKENITKNKTIDTGTMRRSIDVRSLRGELAVLIGSPITDPPYPTFIEFGTAPHVIKNAWGRGITVNHPGTQPKPFLRPALDENVNKAEKEIGIVINQVL